jgi:O-succinylbenzoic acid--CoA ligase
MERVELEEILRSAGVAEEHGEGVFLCDVQWSPTQRAEFARITQTAADEPRSERREGWLCVPTGGSGGGMRFARHDERTLGAAVAGFCAHTGVGRVNAIGVLPLHHVSGLMAAVRCRATGGHHLPWSWPQLAVGEVPALAAGDWFLSLVPTQLQRLLDAPKTVDWLRRFHTIFIGGGPAWPVLMERAAEAKLPLAFSYGLTETAAMVTAQGAGDFAGGDCSSGRPLPHAGVEVVDEASGQPAPAGATGIVRITGESVFRGYYPGHGAGRSFTTGDLGRFDASGALHIFGRRDAVIITGGKKVHPAAVESALRATGLFPDVAVIGLPDAEWGEVVVACYPADGEGTRRLPDLPELAAYQSPKRLLAVADWPRNAQGKVNRPALRAAVSALAGPRG